MSGLVSEPTTAPLVLFLTATVCLLFLGDIYGSAENAENPLTGSFFYLEKMANPDPVPTYTYDEAGVVLKGKHTSLFHSHRPNNMSR